LFKFTKKYGKIGMVIQMSLKIKNLHASCEEKEILKGLNLEIKEGEIHAVMGPNGAGKSTLSKVIMGSSFYNITDGEIYYNDKLLNNMTTDEIAKEGIFLAFQMPPEIEGVTNADFLKTAVHDREDFKLMKFIKELGECAEKFEMKDIIHRSVNTNFSGGERKKNEIMQMYMLKPSLIILDEIDSGLDVDSLKIVCNNILEYYKEKKPAILIITHYQKLLEYIKPDFVHVLSDGKIVKDGDYSLALNIDKNGFDFIKNGTDIIRNKNNNE
jgi:Fe-S cluster assembly ATP-binding protein